MALEWSTDISFVHILEVEKMSDWELILMNLNVVSVTSGCARNLITLHNLQKILTELRHLASTLFILTLCTANSSVGQTQSPEFVFVPKQWPPKYAQVQIMHPVKQTN